MVLLAVLAGCGAAGSYRDPAAPMGATTRFEADRFAGDWQVVARFGDRPVGPMRFDAARGELVDLATGARMPVNVRDGAQVMWVDTGFRTAALGARDGRVGFILDRNAGSAPDRLRAAREIMEFYGWDTARLSAPD